MKKFLKGFLWGVLALFLLTSAAWFVGSAYVKGKMIDAITKNGGSIDPKNLEFGGFPWGYTINIRGLQIDTVYKKAKITGSVEKTHVFYTFFLPFRVSFKGEDVRITVRPLHKKMGPTLKINQIEGSALFDSAALEIKEGRGTIKEANISEGKLPNLYLRRLSFSLIGSSQKSLKADFEGLTLEGFSEKNNPFFPIQRGEVDFSESKEGVRGDVLLKTGISTYQFNTVFKMAQKGVTGSLKIEFEKPYNVLSSMLDNHLFDVPMASLLKPLLKERYEKESHIKLVLPFENGTIDLGAFIQGFLS